MSRAEKDHRNQSRRGKRTTEIKNRRIQETGRRASESLKRKLMLKSFELGRQVGIKSGYAEGYEKGSTESWKDCFECCRASCFEDGFTKGRISARLQTKESMTEPIEMQQPRRRRCGV